MAGRQGGRWYLEGGEDGRGKWGGVGVARRWESKEGVAGMVEKVMVGLDLGFFFFLEKMVKGAILSFYLKKLTLFNYFSSQLSQNACVV